MGPLLVLQEPDTEIYEECLLERLCNVTVALTMAKKPASHRTNLNGARMQANALHTRVVPVEVVLNLEECEPRARSLDQTRIRTLAILRSRVGTSCA